MSPPRRAGGVLLDAVLDRLLPANGDVAAAGELGLGAQVERGARASPALARAVHALLDALPDDFPHLPRSTQDEALRSLEEADAASFAALVTLAYNAYYTDPRVLEQLERVTGYPARPPQPEGYELEPFDESVLETIRKRERLFRDV